MHRAPNITHSHVVNTHDEMKGWTSKEKKRWIKANL